MSAVERHASEIGELAKLEELTSDGRWIDVSFLLVLGSVRQDAA